MSVATDLLLCASCGERHISPVRTPEEVKDVAAVIAAARSVWAWYQQYTRLIPELEALGRALACPDCDRYDDGHFPECPRLEPTPVRP